MCALHHPAIAPKPFAALDATARDPYRDATLGERAAALGVVVALVSVDLVGTLTRAPTPAHVAFGFGEHLCLGAALARLEARVVFDELLARFPGYEIAGAPTYAPSTLTSSIDAMPVLFTS